MNNLVGYFQKFRNIIPRDRLVRSTCAEVIQNITGIILDPHSCKLQQGVLWIRAAGVIRQELDRKKEEMIILLRQKLPTTTITMIRFH